MPQALDWANESRFSTAVIYEVAGCARNLFCVILLKLQVPRSLTAIVDRANSSYLPFLYDNHIIEG